MKVQEVRQKTIDWLRSSFEQYKVYLPVLLPFLFLAILGLRTTDFGYHWDENLHWGTAKDFIFSGEFLPTTYIYPTMGAWLSMLALLPYVIPLILRSGFNWQVIKNFLLTKVFRNPTYIPNIRKIFVAISSLSVVWVYLIAMQLKRHWLEALLAASILGFSWEVAYHSRFIAADALVMQFGALVTFLAVLAVRHPEQRNKWLRYGAIAAGLATSTKYPAGLLLVPVLIAAFQSWDRQAVLGFLRNIAGLGFAFALSYLIITPGTVLDPIQFMNGIRGAVKWYGSGHGFHTVDAGWPHLKLILGYYSQAAFSHFELIAVFFFLFALLGTYSLISEFKGDALLILSFPVLYTLYFSTQRVMMVRNMLVVLPVLALLSARGIHFVYVRLKSKPLQYSWATLVVVLLLINAGWQAYTAGTILSRGTDRYITEFSDYLFKNQDTQYLVSESLWDDLSAINPEMPANLTLDVSAQADMVAVYYSESKTDPGAWPVLAPGAAPEWFGPWDINMDYYAQWQGDDRILYMSMDKARELRLLIFEN